MKLLAATCVLIAVASPAFAVESHGMTGSAYLDPELESFAAGYAWGVVDYRVQVYTGAADRVIQQYLYECLSKGGIDSEVFYQATQRWVENHPQLLTSPAVTGALQTLFAMCPDAPKP